MICVRKGDCVCWLDRPSVYATAGWQRVGIVQEVSEGRVATIEREDGEVCSLFVERLTILHHQNLIKRNSQ